MRGGGHFGVRWLRGFGAETEMLQSRLAATSGTRWHLTSRLPVAMFKLGVL